MDWISTDDRLPRNQQLVWAYGVHWSSLGIARTEVCMCEYSKCYDDWVMPGNHTLESVTHWMPRRDPLKPPTEEE